MATIERKHVFAFSDGETTEEVTVKQTDDEEETQHPYAAARTILCDRRRTTIQAFERSWKKESHQTYVSFADKPWDSGEELESRLQSITGVQYARYVGPMSGGSYGPPRYVLRVEDRSFDSVSAEITAYYDGLTVSETPSSDVCVTISAVRYAD